MNILHLESISIITFLGMVFNDRATFLYFHLMGFQDWKAVERHPIVGALWETHAIMQVVKHFAALGKAVPLWFWRTSQGVEVDLLIERGGRFFAVECKYAETISERDTKALDSFRKAYGPESLIAGYVASRSPRPHTVSSRVKCVPGSFMNEVL